ncbi:MAG: cyclase family protein [Ancalomicrobiaceae bacterium]|nr:cyclase family protein [Ancalomicrobiaceae bacterium]
MTNSIDRLFDPARFDFIDLTHPLRPNMPVWPTHPRFCQEVIESYDRGDVAANRSLSLCEHTGTHFDAPVHFYRGRPSISDIPVERFFGRMIAIDATDVAPKGTVEPDRLDAFEQRYGAIQAGDAVFFHFGWDALWSGPIDGREFLADWPGLSAAASRWLVERGVAIVGCDCLSIDSFGAGDYPAHRILLDAGVLIGENFAGLGRLPPVCRLVALPLALEGGTGAPTRAVALVER